MNRITLILAGAVAALAAVWLLTRPARDLDWHFLPVDGLGLDMED